MLAVSKLITGVKFICRDGQGVDWSDFEIINAINRAARLLYSRLGEKFIHTAIKSSVINVEDGCARLPSDFNNIRKLTADGWEFKYSSQRPDAGEYRIAGGEIYASEGAYKLEYYYLPASVHDWSDSLDASSSTGVYLEQMAASLLNNDIQTAEATAQAACHSLAAGNLSAFNNAGPIEVLGGRL